MKYKHTVLFGILWVLHLPAAAAFSDIPLIRRVIKNNSQMLHRSKQSWRKYTLKKAAFRRP